MSYMEGISDGSGMSHMSDRSGTWSAASSAATLRSDRLQRISSRALFSGVSVPLGENLPTDDRQHQSHEGKPFESDHPVDTIADMFAACARAGSRPRTTRHNRALQMSVRFAFKRNGEIIGEPRVTYTTPGVGNETKQVYRHAIAEALARCTPLPFSDGMGGAVAGRPIAMRVVDKPPRTREPSMTSGVRPDARPMARHVVLGACAAVAIGMIGGNPGSGRRGRLGERWSAVARSGQRVPQPPRRPPC